MATPTTQSTTQPQTQPQLQVYYKPQVGQPGYDANNPQAIYDTAGNIVSLDQYKAATNQSEKADNEVDFSAVQNGAPTGGFSNNPTFDPNSIPGLSEIWGQLTPSQQAFVQSAHGVVQSQYNAGGAATVDNDTWNKALQIAATDPTIQSTYGDAAKEGTQQLGFQLSQITGNYDAAQAAQQATLFQQKKDLDTQIAQAGQAYSGFGEQAKEQLSANQNNIIQSTRSQYATQLQNLGQGYESKFGSTALGTQPPITAGTGANQIGYTPVGGIIGTNTQGQTNAEINTASNLGLLPSASRSTGQVSTTGGGQ